jgi:hypothetical protein
MLKHPGVGWTLLAMLYVAAAVLTVFLALAMSDWWPLLLALVLLVMAGGCVMIGLGSRSQHN